MTKRKGKQFTHRAERAHLRPKTPTQQDYIHALKDFSQVVCMGPAGTGKTYIAAVTSADLLLDRKIRKIVLTRPNVPASERLGFFPGDLGEKMAPWVAPFTSVLQERMGKGHYESAIGDGKISIVPFETMRGHSFEDAFVVLDEAQNATYEELKMFLTRVGENCTVVINGDISQTDLGRSSGLKTIIEIVEREDLPVPIVEFSNEDIVRSGLCRLWVESFEDHERRSQT